MPAILKSGARSAHGGKRKGSGRPPNWLRDTCQSILDKHDLYGLLGRVAAGEESEQRCTKDGEVFTVSVGMHDRLKALEMLVDRAHGKPAQAVEVAGSGGGPIQWTLEIVTKSAESKD